MAIPAKDQNFSSLTGKNTGYQFAFNIMAQPSDI